MSLRRPKKRKDPVAKDKKFNNVLEAIKEFNATYDLKQDLQGHFISKANEFHGPCPKCGGTDRFVVQPKKAKAWCRRCNAWGDTLHWAMVLRGLDPEEPGATAKFLKEKNLL